MNNLITPDVIKAFHAELYYSQPTAGQLLGAPVYVMNRDGYKVLFTEWDWKSPGDLRDKWGWMVEYSLKFEKESIGLPSIST